MPFRDIEIDKLLTARRGVPTAPDQTDRTRAGLEPERNAAADHTSRAPPREPPPRRPRRRRRWAWLPGRSHNN
jgi:hypothetical protein